MPARPRMMPPVGKSGPGTILIRSSTPSAGSSISAMQASITSPRLCGGMLVAMPTAMPPAPLTSRFGKARRQHHRLVLVAVVVGLEVDGVLVDVVEQRHRRLGRAGTRCSAWPPADRRRPSRNCPARRSAAGAWRNPAPCAPARRRSPGRRAGDICPSRRRPRAPTSRISCRACGPARSSNRGCAGAPASGRRARRAARATRSRSWRNRDSCASSPR